MIRALVTALFAGAAIAGMAFASAHWQREADMMEYAAASSRAEAQKLVLVAKLEHVQQVEQAQAAAQVQAQKTATGAALVGAQAQIRTLAPKPHSCDIGPDIIEKLNALRGQP